MAVHPAGPMPGGGIPTERMTKLDVVTLHRLLDAIKHSDETAGIYANMFNELEFVGIEKDELIFLAESPFRAQIAKYRADDLLEVTRKVLPECNRVSICTESEYQARKNPVANDSINPDMRFDTFVQGPGNRFAYTAALAVATKPTQAYNPLFIYGKNGLGKTHLVHAIANKIREEHPGFNIVYAKADRFTNELISAVREGRNEEFRNKYRNADLFLMDDIHFIAGKDQTQDEFFHTFNTLFENKTQIVLTSDCPPNEMGRLHDRLRCRFNWGLIADIHADQETVFAWISELETRYDVNLSGTDRAALMCLDDLMEIKAEMLRMKAEKELLE